MIQPLYSPTQTQQQKVVEHLHANREAIATATNFLDRHFGAQLYPAKATAAAGGVAGAGDSENNNNNPFCPPPLLLDSDQEAFERAAVYVSFWVVLCAPGV